MSKKSDELVEGMIECVTEISETQSAVLDLLSTNLPDLTAKERIFLKTKAMEGAEKVEALVEGIQDGLKTNAAG